MVRVTNEVKNPVVLISSLNTSSISCCPTSILNSSRRGDAPSLSNTSACKPAVNSDILLPTASVNAPLLKKRKVLSLLLAMEVLFLSVLRSSLEKTIPIIFPLLESTDEEAVRVRDCVELSSASLALRRDTRLALKLLALMTSLKVKLRKPESRSSLKLSS